MYKRQKIQFLMIFLLLSFNFLSVIEVKNSQYYFNEKGSQTKAVLDWTVMLYFCADSRDYYVNSSLDNSDNFINDALNSTIYGLQAWYLAAGSESDLNVIVLFDAPYSSANPYGRAKIYKVEYQNVIFLDDWGSTNMGDGDILEDFINYCKANYPATNYALTLSDHGRGYAGYCYDYHAPHPSYDYALGDCLTVEEVGDAIFNSGGVDVLFLNTCLGGSFEAMWEFTDCVDYAVAGESTQTYKCLHHPKDFLEGLSADPTMTPFELAQLGFDKAVTPDHVPLDYYPEQWPTVSFYDLTAFTSTTSPTGSPVNFKEVFEDFCDILFDELYQNITLKRPFFASIRNETLYSEKVFSSKSMMIDLRHFIETVLTHSHEFVNQDFLESYGSLLVYLLTPGVGKPIVDEEHLPADPFLYNSGDKYANCTGFSICFPNTYDMYQEYLYANFYEDMDISTQTTWDDFIFSVYPQPPELPFIHIPEWYEIWINPIDPVIDLHIFLEGDPLKHIGACPPKATPYSMGIELGVEGVEYVDDFLTGKQTVLIPTSSFGPMTKADKPLFEIEINAAGATVANQQLDLTVKLVNGTTVLWEDSQQAIFNGGEILSCEVSSNNEMSDLEPEEPPATTTPPETTEPPTTTPTNSTIVDMSPTGFIGPAYAILLSSSSLLLVISIIVVIRKKKKM
ncbi:MAG: hypothetical protein GF308_21575 [Candidatus Heimdallarchaeota archaeon]|nr:hypothetical protein [Candidatus Heimdallarchaeota archaeon]